MSESYSGVLESYLADDYIRQLQDSSLAAPSSDTGLAASHLIGASSITPPDAAVPLSMGASGIADADILKSTYDKRIARQRDMLRSFEGRVASDEIISTLKQNPVRPPPGSPLPSPGASDSSASSALTAGKRATRATAAARND